MNDFRDMFGALETAAYDTVHGYVDPVTRKRGAVALAPKMGIAPGTLSNKVNVTMDHQLTLTESIPLQLVSGNFAILYAYNQALGHVSYRLPAVDESISDVALLEQYASLHAELGVLATNVRSALRDGRITSEEVQAIRKAFDASARAGLGFLARIEALVDDR